MADKIADEQTDQRHAKVAVITGASSGVGLAAALQFAEAGYDMMLAARQQQELQKVAKQCEERGARALTIATDVTKDQAVHELAAAAVKEYGRIDVWVNDAGVYLTGKFENLPLEDMHRVMETNFFGTVHGSHAALAQFRKQGAGVLINISSVNAAAPQPLVSIYSASKAAVRAFDESLRMELRLDKLPHDIHVCTVMPASIDTPLFQNAANYTGKEIQALEPVYDPTYVAKQIVGLAERPRRELIVGAAGKLMAFQNAHQPGGYERQVSKFTDKDLLNDDKPIAVSEGNLYDSIAGNASMRGGWREKRVRGDHANAAGAGIGLAALLSAAGLGYAAFKKRHNKTKLHLLSR